MGCERYPFWLPFTTNAPSEQHEQQKIHTHLIGGRRNHANHDHPQFKFISRMGFAENEGPFGTRRCRFVLPFFQKWSGQAHSTRVNQLSTRIHLASKGNKRNITLFASASPFSHIQMLPFPCSQSAPAEADQELHGNRRFCLLGGGVGVTNPLGFTGPLIAH